MTPARPRPSGPDHGLHLHPGPYLDPGLHPAEPVVAPDRGPALPGPRPPVTGGEPDGIITRCVRPRRWRRRRIAVPAAVLAAVLAAAVLTGVLIRGAGPAVSNRAQPFRSHAVIHAVSSPPSRAVSHAPSRAVSHAPSRAVSRAPSRAQALHPHAVIHMARARQQSRRQRTAQVAADTVTAAGGGTAAGLHSRGHPGAAHPKPGPPKPPSPGPGPADWIPVSGAGYVTNSSACMVGLWTSQVSAGDPAYISADAYQMGSPYPCQAMVETSTDGGQTWTSGTPVTLPVGTTVGTFSANTGAVYDGPGYLGRACAEASNSTLACTAAVSLGSGAGTPPNPTLPASTRVRATSAGDASVTCDASVNSTTSAKGPGTLVDGEFIAVTASSTASSLCEGWLETSSDQGATWQASPPVTFQAPAKSVTYDFTATTADGTGLLARACAEAPTVSATPYCSWAW